MCLYFSSVAAFVFHGESISHGWFLPLSSFRADFQALGNARMMDLGLCHNQISC